MSGTPKNLAALRQYIADKKRLGEPQLVNPPKRTRRRPRGATHRKDRRDQSLPGHQVPEQLKGNAGRRKGDTALNLAEQMVVLQACAMMPCTEVAKQTGLNRSTVYRIKRVWAEKDPLRIEQLRQQAGQALDTVLSEKIKMLLSNITPEKVEKMNVQSLITGTAVLIDKMNINDLMRDRGIKRVQEVHTQRAEARGLNQSTEQFTPRDAAELVRAVTERTQRLRKLKILQIDFDEQDSNEARALKRSARELVDRSEVLISQTPIMQYIDMDGNTIESAGEPERTR